MLREWMKMSNDVGLYIQTHTGPLNALYVFQDHSQMDTASSYVWLPHHSVWRISFVGERDHYPFSVGGRGMSSVFIFFFFFLSICIQLFCPQTLCAKKYHISLFSWITLDSEFPECRKKSNLSCPWYSPTLLLPSLGKDLLRLHPTSKHRGGPFCHLTTLCSHCLRSQSLRSVTLAAFVQSLGTGISDELEIFGHFFRLRPGKRGQKNKGAQKSLIFLKAQPFPSQADSVLFFPSRESRIDFWRR